MPMSFARPSPKIIPHRATQKAKTAKYNAKLYLTKCVICSDNVEDVHHIAPQKESDDEGFIGHFHKDHKYNLIPLCKKHHQEVHQGKISISGFMMTDKGLELHFNENDKI